MSYVVIFMYSTLYSDSADNSQSNSTSPIQTSASASQTQVLSALPSGGLESGDHEETEMWARQEGQEEEEEEEEEDEDGAGFQRRNAKRGLSYRPLKSIWYYNQMRMSIVILIYECVVSTVDNCSDTVLLTEIKYIWNMK